MDSDTSQKRCPYCEKLLPLTKEYFYKNSLRPNNWEYACKNCCKQGLRKRIPVKNDRPCTKCGETDSAKFYYRKGGKEYRISTCIACCKARQNKEQRAKISRKSTLKEHGVTIEQYETMFIAQKGVCKICGKEETTKKGSLSVDHCHETGKVRGLLCRKCNLGIGFLQHDKELLTRAITYLQESENES